MFFQEAQQVTKNKKLYAPLYSQSLQMLCDESMKYLPKNEFKSALELLEMAQLLSNQPYLENLDLDIKVLVLNNLGCVYRRMGKLEKAFGFMDQAQQTLEQNGLRRYSGITYLNICAICSQSGDHQRSLQYAQTGLIEFQNQLNEVLRDQQSKNNKKLIGEKAKYVAISFFNIAVEEEFLKNFDRSLSFYKQAIETLQNYSSSEANLVEKFSAALQRLQSVTSALPSIPPR